MKFDEALSKLASQEKDVDEETKEDVDDIGTEDINLNFIEKRDNTNEESKDDLGLDDISLEDPKETLYKKLFLLSDQANLIREYLSEEEIESMSIHDVKKWLGFIDLIKTPETRNKIDTILKYIISDGNASMLDAYINSADNNLKSRILDRIKTFVDNDKNTLLHLAVSKNKIDLASKLISSYGIDINIQNSDGRTALYYTNDEKTIDLLIKNGVEVNKKDEFGSAALFRIISKGDLRNISLLVSNGEDVNARDDNGRTPLHYAADSHDNNAEIIDLLIKNGANANDVDKYGETPLDYARNTMDDDEDINIDGVTSNIIALLNGISNIDDIQAKKLMELGCFNMNVPLASKLLEIGVDVMQMVICHCMACLGLFIEIQKNYLRY